VVLQHSEFSIEMGVIGTGLYDDDTAADVRDTWHDLVASGVDPAEATKRLQTEWATSLDDPEVSGPFWRALADTQWKAGRLESLVLDRARAVLSGVEDLSRWTGKDRARRQKVLDRLREQLAKPQRAPRTIRPVSVERTELTPGEVLGWKLPSGVYVLLWVVTLGDYAGNTVPVCALLDWRGAELPGEEALRKLPVRKSSDGLVEFFLCKAGPRDRPPAAVVHLGTLREEVQGRKGAAVMTWKHFPAQIVKLFGAP
jgi:hypothetical protein